MNSIESMTKKELIELYNQIGERIRYLQQMEAQEKMNNFYFDDLVTFTSTDGRVITARVKRFNQKSVSVECEHGTRWTVSPQLLKKIPTGVLSAPYKVLGS
jgi:hypothetical protein